MGNVTRLPERIGATVDAKTGAITVSVLRIDGRRMTKAVFRQIPMVKLREWPTHYLGWALDGHPWLLWSDDGRLVRSDIDGWGRTRPDGTRDHATDRIRQLYLA